MTPEIWKIVYDLTLIPLIVGGLCMIAVMLYRKRYKWGFFFSGVFYSVLSKEAEGILEDGKTISSQYGDWIQAEPFWALSALVLMVIWMVALVAHLFASGFRKRKQP